MEIEDDSALQRFMRWANHRGDVGFVFLSPVFGVVLNGLIAYVAITMMITKLEAVMFGTKSREKEREYKDALTRIARGGGRVLEAGCDAGDVERMLAACVQIAREAVGDEVDVKTGSPLG